MVMHDGVLLIAEVSGAIHRVDPLTGVVESILAGPFGIEAGLPQALYVRCAIAESRSIRRISVTLFY